MSEIKVTQSVIDVLKTTREELVEKIKSGKIKGRIDSNTFSIFVDDTELNEPAQQVAPIPRVRTNSEVKTINDEIELYKAKIQLENARKEYEALVGERLKPEELAKKEQELNLKTATLEDIAKGLKQREDAVTLRENSVRLRESQVDNNELNLKTTLVNLNIEISKKQTELTNLNAQFKQENDKLTKEQDAIKSLVEQAKQEARPIVSWLNSWSTYVKKNGDHFTSKQKQELGETFGKHKGTLDKWLGLLNKRIGE